MKLPPLNAYSFSRLERIEMMLGIMAQRKQLRSWPDIFQMILFKDTKLTDLKIVCEDKEFLVHKLILSCQSDIFNAMFSTQTNFKEANSNVLKIEDTDPDTMEKLLKFIYTNEIKNEEIDCRLLMLADKYNIKALVKICFENLEANLNVENVMEITYVAYLTNNQKLIDAASNFIFHNRGSKQIKKCAFWDELKEQNPTVAMKVVELITFG